MMMKDAKNKVKRTARSVLLQAIRQNETKKYEIELLTQIRALKLPEPKQQYKFHPARDYAFDFAYPEIKFWVEVDGGTWLKKGGHQTGVGYTRDRIRDCEAFILGWKGFRVTGDMVKDASAVAYIEKFFRGFK